MQIADFIEHAKDEILAESVAYARTILSLRNEDDAILRNHLPKVLQAISADLRTPQSRTESIQKSHGLAPIVPGAAASAAETHGVMRARSGLHVEQLAAEYRALRGDEPLRNVPRAAREEGHAILSIEQAGDAHIVTIRRA